MQRHSVRLDYDTRSQAVTVEADGVVVQQQVQNRLGVPLEPWDLHVGAVLDILGQKVTLASCNLAVRPTPGDKVHLTLRYRPIWDRRANENGNLA